jgi:hypothetical protein
METTSLNPSQETLSVFRRGQDKKFNQLWRAYREGLNERGYDDLRDGDNFPADERPWRHSLLEEKTP